VHARGDQALETTGIVRMGLDGVPGPFRHAELGSGVLETIVSRRSSTVTQSLRLSVRPSRQELFAIEVKMPSRVSPSHHA
jgi:hypothetical protein